MRYTVSLKAVYPAAFNFPWPEQLTGSANAINSVLILVLILILSTLSAGQVNIIAAAFQPDQSNLIVNIPKPVAHTDGNFDLVVNRFDSRV